MLKEGGGGMHDCGRGADCEEFTVTQGESLILN